MPDVVARLAAHQPISQGLNRILQGGEGALIVLGTNPALEQVSVDGLDLYAALLDGARVAEVAKMDGAIILDNAWQKILAANAHLAPPPHIPSTESGARHRTAQRVAQLTGLPVVAISKDRAVVTLYLNAEQVDITPKWTVRDQIPQRLQLLFDMRAHFDQIEERLLRMELMGLVTPLDVADLLAMGERVERAAHSIKAMLAETGQESTTVHALLHEQVFEVEMLMDMTLRDYLGIESPHARQRLAGIPPHQLGDNRWLASELELGRPDDGVSPQGNRLLYHVGFWAHHLRGPLLDAFPDAPAMLESSVEDFMAVKGIGVKRATRLRLALDRLMAGVHPIGQRTLSGHYPVI